MSKPKVNPLTDLEVIPLAPEGNGQLKPMESYSKEAKEEVLENLLLDLSISSAMNAKQTAHLLPPEDAAATAVSTSNAFVTLKKARTNQFSELPNLSLLVNLERILQIEPPSTPID